jgi:FixJ family two-component response regulator
MKLLRVQQEPSRINLCDGRTDPTRLMWASACEEALVSTTGPAILPKQKLVFVVDDDPSMLRGVGRLLREHGYDTVLFSSADAFQKHDHFEQAVCVILDIHLSDDSGIEVRHRLKAAGVSLPVIYVTGKDSHATRMAAIASGCVAYLTKPFTAQSLIEPIERAFAGLV